MCQVYHGYKPSNIIEVPTDVPFAINISNTYQQMLHAFIDFFDFHTERPLKLANYLVSALKQDGLYACCDQNLQKFSRQC